MSVVVTGIGACSALGHDIGEIRKALSMGAKGCTPAVDERKVLPIHGYGHADIDVRPFLKRRKDRKLLPRAAHLAIVAAAEAYGNDRNPDTALYMGVGPEPSETETEAAIVASMVDGALNSERLYREGVSKYPPLAALKTLPNLVLAHVAIQLECRGECGTRAGETAAGLMSLHAGYYAIVEGRSPVVLCGAAESLVEPRNRKGCDRAGLIQPGQCVGEASAFLRLEDGDAARERGATILATIVAPKLSFGNHVRWTSPIEDQVGYCGVASGVLWMAMEISNGRDGAITAYESSGSGCALSWTVGTV